MPLMSISLAHLLADLASRLGCAACCQLIFRRLLLGVLRGKLRQRTFNLAPNSAYRNTEDALPLLDEVDDLVGAGALVDRGTIAHQGDLCKIFNTAFTQVKDRSADLLQ